MLWNNRETNIAHWSGGNLSKIKDALSEFESVLNQGSEQVVQEYLEKHPFIFEFLSDDGAGFLVSKYKLADKYVPDFIILSRDRWSNNPCLLCTLIEIENPSMPLFTKTGNPTSQLTHAIRQVQDWKSWLRKNSQYMQQELSTLFNTTELHNIQSHKRMKATFLCKAVSLGVYYRYMVIGGRRNQLEISDLIRLTEMNESYSDIKIVTYDAILAGWVNITYNDASSIFRSWNIVE